MENNYLSEQLKKTIEKSNNIVLLELTYICVDEFRRRIKKLLDENKQSDKQ